MAESDPHRYDHAPAPNHGVIDALTEHARRRGSAPYLTTVAAGEQHTLTYGEADVASRRLAAWLRTEYDAKPGTVLAFAPTNDIPSVLTVLASLRAGGSLLMLGPSDPSERHSAQMTAVRARARIEELPRWQDLPDVDGDAAFDPDADALFFGTSGSTAASKLVAQTQRNAIANAVGLGRHHGLHRGDRVLGCLPIHHVNGLHFTVLGTMVAGAHTVLADAFSPFTYPTLLTTFRPRIASVVPSILEALAASWRRAQLPPGFEYFVTAAAPLPVRTARLAADKLGARVVQGYGLSETTNFSATMPPDLSADAYRRVMLETDIPPVGIPIHGNDVVVLDREGVPVPVGTVGEVCMRGHNVMSRYAGNPEATAEAFRGGWFHSQDLGYVRRDEDTGAEFLVLTGRIKNIAKVAGETVSLEEMDRVLCALPQVRDAACVATADRFTGETIVAAVVLADGADESSLEPHLRARFAAAVLPTRYVRMAAIPRSSTGKLLRPQLSRQIAGTN